MRCIALNICLKIRIAIVKYMKHTMCYYIISRIIYTYVFALSQTLTIRSQPLTVTRLHMVLRHSRLANHTVLTPTTVVKVERIMFLDLNLRGKVWSSCHSWSPRLRMHLRHLMISINWILLLPFSSFFQFTRYNNRSCISNSAICANGTYRRPDCAGHVRHGCSCRPKGAALIQTRRT